MLVAALLLFVAVMASKAATRSGVPALLFFLVVGMLFGGSFISYRSLEMTQFIGMAALCIILFTGGMDTRFSQIRPVMLPGAVLATVGVALTALIAGSFIWLIAPAVGIEMPFLLALLLASTISSTDSASVFSILRSKKRGLKEELRPLLELESGSNDPMAYVLTILLIGVLTRDGEASGWMSLLRFGIQMGVGALAGYLVGRFSVWLINRTQLSTRSLYSILLLSLILFTFGFTDLLGGNGYLAVYIAGLVVGNHKLTLKRPLVLFFEGFTWLVQITMFLTLGLFVNSHELLDPRVLLLGGALGLFLIFAARPAAVLLCMAPFRQFSLRGRAYVSWIGLRGAVPIIFATYPLAAGIEYSGLLFNVVFLATIISLVVQGTTVSSSARLLGLDYAEREAAFDVNLPEDMQSHLTEIEVNECVLENGRTLREITLPENTLVMMVFRDGEYFVPQGKTELCLGDKLLVITDRSKELEKVYEEMGVDEVMKL